MQQKLILVTALFSFAPTLGALGQESGLDPATAIVAIEQAVQSYVVAFNSQDVDKLASHWTADGVYTSRTDGDRVNGREAISSQFKEILESDGQAPSLIVESDSIEFISPRVALERGRAIVTRGEDDVTETQYSAVYVKENNEWLIDRITEDLIVVDYNHYENLQELEWLIGQWVDVGEGFTIDMDCNWTTNQNYITRKFSIVSDDGSVDSSGLQIIGWDAKEGTVRSWLFDSDGGFVSGTWVRRDDKWVVTSVATLADGSSGSYTSIFTPTDDGNYTWQKVNRVFDGHLLPSIDPVVVQRK